VVIKYPLLDGDICVFLKRKPEEKFIVKIVCGGNKLDCEEVFEYKCAV
jgi:hypothetical protein